MRDLVRARVDAVEQVRKARQQLQGFLLRQGRIYSGRGTWTAAHRRWLATVRFDHAAHQIILQEYSDAIADAEQRRDRLTRQIEQCCRSGRSHPWSRRCRPCEAWRS